MKLDLRKFGVQATDPGYIYVIENDGRFKIGKSKRAQVRLRAAQTWLPDMTVVGIKPFWNVSSIERDLHIGFSRCWYSGEWFDFSDPDYREVFIEGFREFSDTDRDRNSIDFIYWFNSNGMSEFIVEQGQQELTLPKFLKQESDVAKTARHDRSTRSSATRPDASADRSPNEDDNLPL